MAGAPPHPIHPSTSPNLNIHPQLRHPRIPPPTQYPSNWRPANFDEYNEWNHSPLGLFPSVLIGPGLNPDPLPRPQSERPPNTGVASTNNTGAASADNTNVTPTNNSGKRRHNNQSGETSSVGGFGPSPGDTTMEASSQGPSPPAFTPSARSNGASDVWVFARPLTSADAPPEDQWSTSSEPHNANRPQTVWFGCILCTEYGCAIRLLALGALD